jgi:hypothetical protein
MTPTGNCFVCQQPVLIVAMDTKTIALEPDADPNGTVEVRRSGLGWRGRWTGKGTAPTYGWTSKHVTHTCKAPMEAP